MSVALPGLAPLIPQTPGCASLARSYSLSALAGRETIDTSQTQVYKVLQLWPTLEQQSIVVSQRQRRRFTLTELEPLRS